MAHGPTRRRRSVKTLDGLDDTQVAKITHENAMRHYQFDPFAHRAKDQCCVGSLRGEASDVDTVTRVGRPADERDIAAWQRISERVVAENTSTRH